jgi:hypothetical protein
MVDSLEKKCANTRTKAEGGVDLKKFKRSIFALQK